MDVSKLQWRRGKCLGRGAQGEVFVAIPRDPSLPQMAVKSAPADQSSALISEHRILDTFRGVPGIIQCFGGGYFSTPDQQCCDCEGRQFTYDLFMEYAANGSLADLIADYRRQGKPGIPESHVRVCTKAILIALSSVHSRGYTHCDVKPDNILVFPSVNAGRLQLKLADFGMAVKKGELDPRRSRLRGNLWHMPPEVAVLGMVSPAMDIWGLGCSVIEMLTGELPWDGCRDSAKVLAEIENGNHPQIPHWLSREGQDFLNRCFARNPKHRLGAGWLLRHPFIAGHRKQSSPCSCFC